MTTPARCEYVGRHRGTEFPDSSGKGWIFSAYIGKHRTDVVTS